jgi:hypothetical protein
MRQSGGAVHVFPRVAIATWLVLAIVCVPGSAGADAAGSYLILLPREGAVTDATTLLRVQQQGGSISTTFRFTVAVDGRGVDEQGRLTDPADAFAFPVPGGAVRDINLRGLAAGLHTLRVVPSPDPSGASAAPPAPVHFTVGPGYDRGKLSVPFLIGVVAFGLLLFLSRRRIAGFARSFDRPDDEDDDDEPPRRGGWGPDGPDDPWA